MKSEVGFLKINMACLEQGKLWFVPYNTRSLYALDLASGGLMYYTSITVPRYASDLFKAMIKIGDCIILAPYAGNCFYFYHLQGKNFKIVELNKNRTYDFSYGYQYQNCAYFTGTQPVIAKVNPETYSIELFDIVLNDKASNGIWSRGKAWIHNGKLILPNAISSNIYYWDICTKEGEFKKIDLIDRPLSDLVITDAGVYGLPRSGKLVYVPKRRCGTTAGFETGQVELDGYFHLFCAKNDTIIINYLNGDIYVLDVEKTVFRKVEGILPDAHFDGKVMRIRWVELENSVLYLNTMDSDNLVSWDLKTNLCSEISIRLLNSDQYIRQTVNVEGIVYENKLCADLNTFLQVVRSGANG